MVNFKNLSKQYRWQIVRKGLSLCPVCGGRPSPRSKRGKLCEVHIEAAARRMNKKINAKRRFATPQMWLSVDWTLGIDLVAVMLGVTRATATRKYKILVTTGKLKRVTFPV